MVSGQRRAPQRASGDTTTRGHLSLRDNSDYRSVSLKRESPSNEKHQSTGNDASGRKFRFIAAIGASAVVTVGALVWVSIRVPTTSAPMRVPVCPPG